MPIIHHMKAHLCGADRIVVDETRALVLDPGRKATKSGFFWAVVSDDRGHGGAGPPIVLFHYAPGRGKEHPLKFLAGYRGRFLQCDAYQSYNALMEIERDGGPWQLVYCWTLVRRRFVKRFENDRSPSPRRCCARSRCYIRSRRPCAARMQTCGCSPDANTQARSSPRSSPGW